MSFEDPLTISRFRLNVGNEFLIVVGAVRVPDQLGFSSEGRFLKNEKCILFTLDIGRILKKFDQNYPSHLLVDMETPISHKYPRPSDSLQRS